jgi:hypothetical protein
MTDMSSATNRTAFCRVRLDDEMRNAGVAQPLDQSDGDGVVLRDDDVAAHVGRHLPRGAQPHARLEPGRVELPDEPERQHHQEEHDTGEEHDDAEQTADVAGERDVAEPQRGHHDQRPVEAGDPRVLLALDADHDRKTTA